MLPARLPPDRVVATYTWIAPTHDLLARVVEARARRLLLNWADVQNGERVLEVGVGTGLSFAEVLRRNPDGYVEGVDRTPAMLRRARRKAKKTGHTGYHLALGDARALSMPDASFDVVLCSYMFDLLPEYQFTDVLRGFRRVLRPGGRLVMANMTTGRAWHERLWEGLYRLYPPLLGGCRGIEVAASLHEAGFERIRRAFVRQWLFPSEVVYAECPGEG